MKPPRSGPPDVPSSAVLPEKADISGLQVSAEVKVAASSQRPELDTRRRQAVPLSQSDRSFERLGNLDEALALRLSVIDGGDRMVYTDLRDRKGWAQPLVIDQALRDASRYLDATNTVPASPPRVVRAVESLSPRARGVSMPVATTAYQAGKSSARGGAAASFKPNTSINMPTTAGHSAPRRAR